MMIRNIVRFCLGSVYLVTFISTTLHSENTVAAAFQSYELATPIIGLAGVGQAAVANDASTAYFNPAGMSELENSQMMVGTQLMNSQIQFGKNELTTISGPASNKTNLIIPAAGLYYVDSYSPYLKYGISLTSPYGGIIDYGDGWSGRYFVQNTALVTLDLNPVVALQMNDWLSLGGGVVLQYAQLNQTSALPLPDNIDGQTDLRVSTTDPGFNLGVLVSCNERLRLGVAYRSQIKQTLKGRVSFLRLNTMPASTVKITTPHNVIASMYLGCNDCLALLGELGWANWRCFQNTVVTIEGFSLAIPRHWRNTYRAGLGAEYQWTPQVTGTLGISYDSSPTTVAHRLPDLPMDRQVRYGIGLIYTTANCTRLAFQYAFIDLGKAPLNINTRLGTLAGAYSKNFLHVLGINVNFGL